MAPSPSTLLTEGETAARLGLHVTTLRRWRWARHGIAFVKLGKNGAVRYHVADVEAFISAGRVEPRAKSEQVG